MEGLETLVDEMFWHLVWTLEKWFWINSHNFLRYTRYGLNKPWLLHPAQDLKVLHKSENFLVVNKSFDIVINSETSDLTLYGQIQRKFPELCDFQNYRVNNDSYNFDNELTSSSGAAIFYQFGFRVLHRLDYSTSGIMVIPLTAQSCKTASKAFSGRTAKKYYLAILRGHLSQRFLCIRHAVGDDSRPKWKNIKMCTSRNEYCENPRMAETKLIVLSKGMCGGYPATKVLLRPVTGRRHQLRVHCHEIGHRIVGDFTYSDRRDVLPYRMFLHAQRIVLPNAVESLDVCTADPFLQQEDDRNDYEATETFCSIDDPQGTYDLFDEDEGLFRVV